MTLEKEAPENSATLICKLVLNYEEGSASKEVKVHILSR